MYSLPKNTKVCNFVIVSFLIFLIFFLIPNIKFWYITKMKLEILFKIILISFQSY